MEKHTNLAGTTPFNTDELNQASDRIAKAGHNLGDSTMKNRFAFLPTTMSTGETIWLKTYREAREFVGRGRGYWMWTGIKFNNIQDGSNEG